jgi:hypothetical protein
MFGNWPVAGTITDCRFRRTAGKARMVGAAAARCVAAPRPSRSPTNFDRSAGAAVANLGSDWISDQKVLDLSAYGKFVDNASQKFGPILVSRGSQRGAFQATSKSPVRRRCRSNPALAPRNLGNRNLFVIPP